jgi:hypothetical protein
MARAFSRSEAVGVLADTGYSGGVPEMGEIDAAARTLGLEVVPMPIRRAARSSASTFLTRTNARSDSSCGLSDDA